MKNFVQKGDTLDFVAPAGGVVSGSVYKIGGFLCVAATTTAEGLTFAGDVVGVFDVAAEGAGSGQVWAVGDLIYWDNTAKLFTKTSTSNTKAGLATAAKLTAATSGQLKLIPNV